MRKVSHLLNKSSVIITGIVIIFAIYAFSILNRQSLSHDEFYTLGFIKGFDIYLFNGSDLLVSENHNVSWYQAKLRADNFWPNLYRNLIHEGHPPLYYMVLKLWTYLFGATSAGLRSFSIVISCISLITAYRIGRWVSTDKAFLFPLLLSTSPIFIYYSIEARSYSLYILLGLLCFLFFLRLLSEIGSSEGPSPKTIAGYLISGASLVYTHYYGVFLFVILASVLAYMLIRRKNIIYLSLLTLPGFAFFPWIWFVKQQTTVHKFHWTNGYLGFIESVNSFGQGSISLIAAPFNNHPIQEFWFPIMALVIVAVTYILGNELRLQKTAVALSLVLSFALSIIIFDKLMDHHTVAVPRYYIPLQFILLFLFYYLVVYGRLKWLVNSVAALWIINSIGLQVGFHNGSREPRQMYREVASYISQRYDPKEVEIVVCPAGPSAVALAFYLNKGFRIRTLPAEKICGEYSQRGRVLIEQRLGLKYEAWKVNCKPDYLTNRVVRFVGLDLINEK